MKNEPKVSFIIPCYKGDEYIFRNIDSIFDQDYLNYEIIVVLNGLWETKNDLIQKLQSTYNSKINLFSIDQGGLGNANNFGFSHVTGDIISHLSSDLYLLPGTLHTWVETLDEHPKCGFVYSGHKLVGGAGMDIYWSNDFDRYHLECENYIDGANPIRRENWKPWDKELKSLIDWDFFLSVTDDGTIGHYIKEPLYFANPPMKGGLSDDSNTHWVYRRRQIQQKHGIPDRKICIASLLDSDYALELAKLIDADFRVYPGHKPHKYNLIYTYGFPCDLDNIRMSTGIFFQHYGHKVIHWTGKDLRTLLQLKTIDAFYYCDNVLSKIKEHFCMNTNDQRILGKFGINAEVIYPPTKWDGDIEKIDAISMNDPDLMDQLKKAIPDIEFHLNNPACNISVHFEDRMDRVLKSICLGNHVISNIYLPGTHYVTAFNNVPELRKMLVHTIRQIKKMNQPVDQEDVKFYRDRTTVGYFKNKLERISEKKVEKYGKLMDYLPKEANA